jgi:hypothetical protein
MPHEREIDLRFRHEVEVVREHGDATGELQRLLTSYEPEPVPVQLVQLPGTSSLAAKAFVEHAAEGLERGLFAVR